MKQMGKEKQKIGLGMIVLGVVAVLLIIRAHYGMDVTDETMYLSIAKRFAEGDMLFKDEWNTCQLFGLLMLPLYKGYVWIRGSSDGIILFSRELFVGVTLVVACFAFWILYQYIHNVAEALIIALCMFLYVRGNIITFSYYSMAQICFLLAIFLWLNGELMGGHKKICYMLSGISYALSVVSMPYLAVLFAGILFLGVLYYIKKDQRKNKIICFISGVVLAAGIFLLLYGRWIPWKNLWDYLPFMFLDPAMEHEGVLGELLAVGKYITTVFLKYTWWLYALTLIACIFGKNRKKEIKIALLGEFFLQAVYLRTYFEGGILIGVFLLAVQLCILERNFGRERWIKYFVVPGMLYGLLWIIGSNIGERVMNMGFLMADIWAIDVIWNSCSEEIAFIKIVKRTSVLWLLGILSIIRFADLYRDGELSAMTTKVETGSYQGIYTEENRAVAYKNTVDLLRNETDTTNKIVVVGRNPWIYLESPAKCSAYTAWNIQGEDLVAEKYYSVFPEKEPDVIVTVDPEVQTYKTWRFSSHGSGMQNGELLYPEGVYKKLLQDGVWETKQAGKSILYKRVE
ncbi:hypothetical protein DWZ37_09780 [Clostridiaceae bacterium AF31-3BH]|nr:hypothetical protein DWZ37_09780 [Clostridiaceae bacterium AF31-3BH]